MLYEVNGSFQFPDLPTDQLVDVVLYYSKKLLKPYKFERERPVFYASDLEAISISIIEELNQAEKEIKNEQNKKTINNFLFMNAKYKAYLAENKEHLSNRIFSEFLENEKHKLIFTLSLFSYKNYKSILDDIFREHIFEFKFISYLTTYFYYESVRFDKNIRSRNEKEYIVLDTPLNEGGSIKDTIVSPKQEPTINSGISIEDRFFNEKLANSFQVLTPHQRSILIMYYVEGYKDLEIAEKLSISPQAVSKSKKSAIHKLKQLMKGGWIMYGRSKVLDWKYK